MTSLFHARQVGRGGRQVPRTSKRKIVRSACSSYLLYLPEEYSRSRPWPLLLFLHGAGERGNDLSLVTRHGPPKLIAAGKQFPCIVVSPQCPQDEQWTPENVGAVLDDVTGICTVDPDRVYLTGLSMGGAGTWATGIAMPNRFAALAPLCAWGDPFMIGRLKNIPVWAFHGEKDDVVPCRRGADMIEALRQAGGSPQFTVYPDAGHDCWTETYNNPGLYSWFLQHSRPR